MTAVWTWDAEAPGGSGAGASCDEDRAWHAAEEWVRGHPRATATVQRAELVVGSGLGTGYAPAGDLWESRRHPGGAVTWTRQADRAG